jgi:hypothetical protein
LPHAHSGEPALGRYFAECAWLEAASVVAFRELALELARFGAPQPLLDSCEDAAADEERHTKFMNTLRERFGGAERPVQQRPQSIRTLFEVARENAVEGVVRETFGAAVALYHVEHAKEPELRHIFGEIAEDECRHAELASAVAAFLGAALDPSERDELARCRDAAIAELRASLANNPPSILTEVAGVPGAEGAQVLLEGLRREVWASNT